MSARQKPMLHPPVPYGESVLDNSTMRYLQKELALGKLIGTGEDGEKDSHPYCAMLGLEVKRNTPDLLLTGFPLDVGLKFLQGVASASDYVNYAGRNATIVSDGQPVAALLGERDLSGLVPDIDAFYLNRRYRLVQCVLADPSGLFPWDPGFCDPFRQYYWGRGRFASWDDIPLNGIR